MEKTLEQKFDDYYNKYAGTGADISEYVDKKYNNPRQLQYSSDSSDDEQDKLEEFDKFVQKWCTHFLIQEVKFVSDTDHEPVCKRLKNVKTFEEYQQAIHELFDEWYEKEYEETKENMPNPEDNKQEWDDYWIDIDNAMRNILQKIFPIYQSLHLDERDDIELEFVKLIGIDNYREFFGKNNQP